MPDLRTSTALRQLHDLGPEITEVLAEQGGADRYAASVRAGRRRARGAA